jgi:hypothetical protein
MGSFTRTVTFAKGMTASGKGHGFFVIHGHTPEGFANVAA